MNTNTYGFVGGRFSTKLNFKWRFIGDLKTVLQFDKNAFVVSNLLNECRLFQNHVAFMNLNIDKFIDFINKHLL